MAASLRYDAMSSTAKDKKKILDFSCCLGCRFRSWRDSIANYCTQIVGALRLVHLCLCAADVKLLCMQPPT